PLIQLKTHQRRHPLVIPPELTSSEGGFSSRTADEYANHENAGGVGGAPLVQRHFPVLKQVTCPQAPAAFLSVYNKTNHNASSSSNSNNANYSADCDKYLDRVAQWSPSSTNMYDYNRFRLRFGQSTNERYHSIVSDPTI